MIRFLFLRTLIYTVGTWSLVRALYWSDTATWGICMIVLFWTMANLTSLVEDGLATAFMRTTFQAVHLGGAITYSKDPAGKFQTEIRGVTDGEQGK